MGGSLSTATAGGSLATGRRGRAEEIISRADLWEAAAARESERKKTDEVRAEAELQNCAIVLMSKSNARSGSDPAH